ncbi:MAG: hypothetical protein H0W21_08445 [Actinobacteria bacterium]|nr:hypothetical protein [Actinomycetota bacterium]
MTPDAAVTALGGALAGYAIGKALVAVRIKAPPARSMRTNVNGRRVPVVLGGPLALGAMAGMALVAMAGAVGWGPAIAGPVTAGTSILIVALSLAGSLDDRRGDEPDRGFRGHLRAAWAGRVTGGLVKLVTGGLAGLAAGALVSSGVMVLVVGAAVALGANLLNLTDRAPGRAGKVWLLGTVPLLIWGDPVWAVAAAPLAGALIGCLGADLRERAMLGDAGANPLGAVMGLGLGASLSTPGLLLAVALLLAGNLASEKWSFSSAIDRTRWLRAVDRLGRK